MPFLYYTVPIVIFALVFLLEKRSMWIGFLFISITSYLTVLTIIYLEFYHQKIAFSIVILLLAIIIILVPFYIISFVIALITSGIRLINKEGRKLHNYLSLGLGFFIIIWLFVMIFIHIPDEQILLQAIDFFISTSIIYLICLIVAFAVSSLLNRFRNPFKIYDYIIVLGSGLIGDRVPPLLASRIDKGIDIFNKQWEKNKDIKLIFTGGQGDNEWIAEGEAMARYAIEKGVPKNYILVEDKALNTYENILFSKQIIKLQKNNRKVNIITVTNNFHLFRALLWTRIAGIKSDGAGSKTRFYFWLNALIREFIAVLFMHKKYHIFIFILLFLFASSTYVFNKYFSL